MKSLRRGTGWTGGLMLACFAGMTAMRIEAAPESAHPTPAADAEKKCYDELKKLKARVEHKLMKRGVVFLVRGPKAKVEDIRKAWHEYWVTFEALKEEEIESFPLQSLHKAMKDQKFDRDDIKIDDGVLTIFSTTHFPILTELQEFITNMQYKYEGKAQ